MSAGQLIVQYTTPCLNAIGEPAAGATLTIYQTGTSTIAAIYADNGLTTPIGNPLTADSAGRFVAQTTVIWASDAMAYKAVINFPDGSTLTFDNLNVLEVGTNLSAYAPLNSPAFTGIPTAPTPATNDISNKIATTGFVNAQGYASLASPVFTGNPVAPTQISSDNSTKLATTAFVQSLLSVVAESIGTSGYIKFSNGLYVQWGQFTITIGSSGTVTFNTVFPTACYSCIIQPGGSNNTNAIWYVSSISASSFNWTYATTGGSASYTSYYIAIGN